MVRQRFSAIEKRSRRWPIQGAEQLQQSRFTASTRTRNGDELAFPDGEVDPAQGADLTVVKFTGESFCLEERESAGRRRGHIVMRIRPAQYPARHKAKNRLIAVVVVLEFLLCLVQSVLLFFDLFLGAFLAVLSALFESFLLIMGERARRGRRRTGMLFRGYGRSLHDDTRSHQAVATAGVFN